MCHPRSILKVGGRGALTHVPPQINFLYLFLVFPAKKKNIISHFFFKVSRKYFNQCEIFGKFFFAKFCSLFYHFRFIHFREISRISLWNTNEKFCLFFAECFVRWKTCLCQIGWQPIWFVPPRINLLGMGGGLNTCFTPY